MISLTADTPILLATHPADFRKGIDGIAALCRQQLAQNPRNGTVFVFINRTKTQLRMLTYDGTGFWLMTKRLSQGRFKGWPTDQQKMSMTAAKQLRILLSGENPWQKV
mgnify:FL=1|jgi:transposase